MLPVAAVAWSPDRRALRYLDQRALPAREEVHDVRALEDIIDAIRTLAIRGAPAIGVGAAIGLVIALEHAGDGSARSVRSLLPGFAARLEAARPTAVNLAWAVGRMAARAARETDDDLLAALRDEAECILREDIAMCESIGQHGLVLIPDGTRVLTHCNAGALATAGIGTALAPVYAAHALGLHVKVYADETRPLRQGARLTAWELQRAGIEVTVIPDGAAAALLRTGEIDLVIVGADRIAANGDVANKIGTYGRRARRRCARGAVLRGRALEHGRRRDAARSRHHHRASWRRRDGRVAVRRAHVEPGVRCHAARARQGLPHRPRLRRAAVPRRLKRPCLLVRQGWCCGQLQYLVPGREYRDRD